jgi:hypothetical protein
MHVTELHQQSSQLYMDLVLININIKNLYLTQLQASTKFKVNYQDNSVLTWNTSKFETWQKGFNLALIQIKFLQVDTKP